MRGRLAEGLEVHEFGERLVGDRARHDVDEDVARYPLCQVVVAVLAQCLLQLTRVVGKVAHAKAHILGRLARRRARRPCGRRRARGRQQRHVAASFSGKKM